MHHLAIYPSRSIHWPSEKDLGQYCTTIHSLVVPICLSVRCAHDYNSLDISLTASVKIKFSASFFYLYSQTIQVKQNLRKSLIIPTEWTLALLIKIINIKYHIKVLFYVIRDYCCLILWNDFRAEIKVVRTTDHVTMNLLLWVETEILKNRPQ